jgi:hypothetical protein
MLVLLLLLLLLLLRSCCCRCCCCRCSLHQCFQRWQQQRLHEAAQQCVV